MIPESSTIKIAFLQSLNDCRILFRHCLNPIGVHSHAGVEAAFLQFQRSWETFLEDSMLIFLCGKQPINGLPLQPKFVVHDIEVARDILYNSKPFVEWVDRSRIINRYRIFFETINNSNRLTQSILTIYSTMEDIRIIRNAIAHSSLSCLTQFRTLYITKIGGNPAISRPSEFLIYNDSANTGFTYFDTYTTEVEATVNSIIG